MILALSLFLQVVDKHGCLMNSGQTDVGDEVEWELSLLLRVNKLFEKGQNKNKTQTLQVVPNESGELFVKLPDRRTITLNIGAGDTIDNVKGQIQ